MIRQTGERSAYGGAGGGGGGYGGKPSAKRVAPSSDLDPYASGGQYSPENIVALLNSVLGAVPTMSAPSASMARQYGYGAMDLASRAGAVQAGNAAMGLGGLNPQARAAALSQISQSAMAPAAQAGASGYGQGLGLLGNVGQANLGALMQNRGVQSGLFGQSLGIGAQSALTQYQNQQEMARLMKQLEMQKYLANQEQETGIWGAIGGGLGSIFGGPVGGKLFDLIF